MKYDLLAYSMDFGSFFLQKTKHAASIKSVILFGSVARFESDKKSDVDIFVDVSGDPDEVQKESADITDDFYDSIKFTKYWKLLNVTNKFKVMAGRLGQWELKNSIISNGIILYGKYKSLPEKGAFLVLFSFENISPNTRRVMLNKKIFGYSHSGRRYEGLLEQFQGTKLSKGTIAVPVEHSNPFMKLFRDFKIPVRIRKVIDYSGA
ncbi:nucleotidyltransferase domain-containing protein [Candidatus Woesearchaeota archaeon]|nr:nucleotidyltransferase domain-containing protein [Candidatus Woesearchaeota archaeon]